MQLFTGQAKSAPLPTVWQRSRPDRAGRLDKKLKDEHLPPATSEVFGVVVVGRASGLAGTGLEGTNARIAENGPLPVQVVLWPGDGCTQNAVTLLPIKGVSIWWGRVRTC
jgi:hypothetical protein